MGLVGHRLRCDRVSRLAAVGQLPAQAVDLAPQRPYQVRQWPLEGVDPLEDPPRGGQRFLAGGVGGALGVVAYLAGARLRRIDDRPDLVGDDRAGPVGCLRELLRVSTAPGEGVELAVNCRPSGSRRC
jgi:hypothetical protein